MRKPVLKKKSSHCVNKLKHFLLLLAVPVLLTLQGGEASAEVKEFTSCDYFRGTIGSAPVRILLSSTDSIASGFLFYEKTGVPFWINGSQQNEQYHLTEYLDEEQGYSSSNFSNPDFKTGVLVLLRKGDVLSGEWKNPAGTKSLPVKCTLVNETLKDPQQLLKLIGAESSRMEMMTAMSRWLTGPVPEIFYLDSYYDRWSDPAEIPAGFFLPAETESSIRSADITDAAGDEILFQLNIRDCRALFFVLENRENAWAPLQEYLELDEDPEMVRCLGNEDGFFVQDSLIPVCTGRSILQLITENGYCDGPSRGRHVERKLYRVSDGVFSELLWLVEHDYWYNSPCGNATHMPAEISFEYVKEAGEKYPSRLKCTHSIYRMGDTEYSDGGCPTWDAIEAGQAIQWVLFCEDED